MKTEYHKYLWYVLRHKYYVMTECFKEGLYWQGITHDLSKFLPSEFIPYAQHFHGPGKNITAGRSKTGYYKPTDTGDPQFDEAWFLHQKRNAHHWQHWCCPEAGEEAVPFPMPIKYLREMICDWKGAGRAQGNQTSTKEWYLANCRKMVLHPETRGRLEQLLGITHPLLGVAVQGYDPEDSDSDPCIYVMTTGTTNESGPSIEARFAVAEGVTIEVGDLVYLDEAGLVRSLTPHASIDLKKYGSPWWRECIKPFIGMNILNSMVNSFMPTEPIVTHDPLEE